MSQLKLTSIDISLPYCIVCGSSRGVAISRRSGFDVLLCPCGGLYLSPTVADEAVDPTVEDHPPSFYALPAAMKVRWLTKTCAEGTLLEVGFGEGYFLKAARDYGFHVAGIELHPERAARVSEALGIDVECAAIESAVWPAGSCDVVYHCDLLSHFSDPVLALQRMARLLSPTGVLFFEVGFTGSLVGYRWLPDVPRHRWFFSAEPALHRLLARAGLRIERIKLFGLAPHVLTYAALSSVYQTVKRVTGVAPFARTSSGSLIPADYQFRERRLEPYWHNFMRYSVGAIAPKVGPLTAFVIARPG